MNTQSIDQPAAAAPPPSLHVFDDLIHVGCNRVARDRGFQSFAEMISLVGRLDLSTTDHRLNFNLWKNAGGTRSDLLNLPTKD